MTVTVSPQVVVDWLHSTCWQSVASLRLAEHDLETLFWQWGERFPSLSGMERWQWQNMPFWQVIAEASLAAREAGHAVREMERWMVPNKLRDRLDGHF